MCLTHTQNTRVKQIQVVIRGVELVQPHDSRRASAVHLEIQNSSNVLWISVTLDKGCKLLTVKSLSDRRILCCRVLQYREHQSEHKVFLIMKFWY